MDKEHLRENDLVRRLSDEFMSKIVPSQIIPHLDVHYISRYEESLINAKETNEGQMVAAYLLLNLLSQKQDWFNNLLRTLRLEKVQLHHVADKFEEIKRQVDNHWNSFQQKNPHSVSDINQATVNKFKFGKLKKDYTTDVGRPGMTGARSADNKSDKAQSCSQVAEELEGVRANETANKRDSGKNTKRVTHEENENNNPTSHVCGSSYNHCEQQKLNDLEEKIIAFLKTKTEPQLTLTIAKACGCETRKDVNPSLYGLAKKNIIKQCDTRSPTWQMM